MGEEWKPRVYSGHDKFKLLGDIQIKLTVRGLDMPIWNSEEKLELEM